MIQTYNKLIKGQNLLGNELTNELGRELSSKLRWELRDELRNELDGEISSLKNNLYELFFLFNREQSKT